MATTDGCGVIKSQHAKEVVSTNNLDKREGGTLLCESLLTDKGFHEDHKVGCH
jgi:hypothetical protein